MYFKNTFARYKLIHVVYAIFCETSTIYIFTLTHTLEKKIYITEVPNGEYYGTRVEKMM